MLNERTGVPIIDDPEGCNLQYERALYGTTERLRVAAGQPMAQWYGNAVHLALKALAENRSSRGPTHLRIGALCPTPPASTPKSRLPILLHADKCDGAQQCLTLGERVRQSPARVYNLEFLLRELGIHRLDRDSGISRK